MKKNYPLLIIIAFALLLRLFFAFSWHEIWWDSGVYIGMGKYIFSGGESGLWEHIRPPFVPFVLGVFWILNLDPVLFGRLFEIFLFCGIVWLTYLLAKEWFDERTALLSALIISLSPIFFYLSFHQYTEIPAVFFILLSIYLFVKNRSIWSGIVLGLAFLSKFPAGIFLLILCIAALLNKNWKSALFIIAGFSIPSIPYLIWSWFAYGSPFATLIAAQDAISRALGCNVLRYMPWWQYSWWLVFSETKLHLFAIFGLFVLFKKRKNCLFALCLFVPLLYFSQMHCRDYRYLALFLPFVAMLTSLGIIWLFNKFGKKKFFYLLLIILGIWMLRTSLFYYYGNEVQSPDLVAEEYFSFLSDKSVTGEVWTSNPIIAAHTDARLDKIYYPIFDKELSTDFSNYLSERSGNISYVFLDNCGGGIICPPGEDCGLDSLQLKLDSLFVHVFDKSSNGCWYRIWRNRVI